MENEPFLSKVKVFNFFHVFKIFGSFQILVNFSKFWNFIIFFQLFGKFKSFWGGDVECRYRTPLESVLNCPASGGALTTKESRDPKYVCTKFSKKFRKNRHIKKNAWTHQRNHLKNGIFASNRFIATHIRIMPPK